MKEENMEKTTNTCHNDATEEHEMLKTTNKRPTTKYKF